MHISEKKSELHAELPFESKISPPNQELKDLSIVHISEDLFIGERIPTLLPCKHWLENCDPKHRYGTYLQPYYAYWRSLKEVSDKNIPEDSCKEFFQWFDDGDGKYFDLHEVEYNKSLIYCDKAKDQEVATSDSQSTFVDSHILNFEKDDSPKASSEKQEHDSGMWYSTCSSSSSSLLSYCENNQIRPRNCVSRKKLEESKIKYCSSTEKEMFQVEMDWEKNKLRWKNRPGRPFLDTFNGNKWIFVIDENLDMFVNQKQKASFHHSSFVSGKPVRAAGRIDILNGKIMRIAPNSGHYLTSIFDLTRALYDAFGNCILPISSFRVDIL